MFVSKFLMQKMGKLSEFQSIKKELDRKVSKAFLIKGGSEGARMDKCSDLTGQDQFLMYGSYEGKDELAVIFSTEHADFHSMTFEEAKKLAGNNILSPDFRTSTFGREPRFGIIDVTNLKQTPKFR